MKPNNSLILWPVLALISACSGEVEQHMHENAEKTATSTGLEWAVNIGGPAYVGVDGTEFEAESSLTGGTKGEIAVVKGSQDPALYGTYREGDIEISHAIKNGTYDVTFHFAEPADQAGGARVFNTIVNGEVVIRDLDIVAFRDGKADSALSVTVPNVQIADSKIDVSFAAVVGVPTLSGMHIRDKNRAASDWRLVWSDEFEGDSLDLEKWSFNIWPARKVNDEDQAYTDRARNIRIEDGKLVIEAHKEDYDGASYTSGRIHSSGKGDFLYGRAEVRAKLPRGMGTWPAIWMLPSDPFRYATTCGAGTDWQGIADCDAWPNSGEIDIMEHVGYQMGHVHGTVHNEAYYWLKWEQRKGRILLDDVDQDFHVYALEWTPERIDIFADDTHYFTYVNEGTGWRAWPYDHPFHLILNVAVGGMWGRSGGGIDDSIFPQQMEVDYVRVYEQAAAD